MAVYSGLNFMLVSISSPPGVEPWLEIYRDETPDLVFTVYNPDKTLANLTGCDIIWAAKLERDLPNALATIFKTVAGGGITPASPTTSQFTVHLVLSDTKSLKGLTYLWSDALVTTPDGRTFPIAQHQLKIIPNSSRAP